MEKFRTAEVLCAHRGRSLSPPHAHTGCSLHADTNAYARMHAGQGTRREGEKDSTQSPPLCWESTVTYRLSLALTASRGTISASVIQKYELNHIRASKTPHMPLKSARLHSACENCGLRCLCALASFGDHFCLPVRTPREGEGETGRRSGVCPHWFASRQRTARCVSHSTLFYLPKLNLRGGNNSLNKSCNSPVIQKVNI